MADCSLATENHTIHLDPGDTFAKITNEHDNLLDFVFTTTWFPFGNLAYLNPNQIPLVILLLYTSDYVSCPFAATPCPLVLIPPWLTIDNDSIVQAIIDHHKHLQDYFSPGIILQSTSLQSLLPHLIKCLLLATHLTQPLCHSLIPPHPWCTCHSCWSLQGSSSPTHVIHLSTTVTRHIGNAYNSTLSVPAGIVLKQFDGNDWWTWSKTFEAVFTLIEMEDILLLSYCPSTADINEWNSLCHRAGVFLCFYICPDIYSQIDNEDVYPSPAEKWTRLQEICGGKSGSVTISIPGCPYWMPN